MLCLSLSPEKTLQHTSALPPLCTHRLYSAQDGSELRPAIPQYVIKMIDIKLPFEHIRVLSPSKNDNYWFLYCVLCIMCTCGSEEKSDGGRKQCCTTCSLLKSDQWNRRGTGRHSASWELPRQERHLNSHVAVSLLHSLHWLVFNEKTPPPQKKNKNKIKILLLLLLLQNGLEESCHIAAQHIERFVLFIGI